MQVGGGGGVVARGEVEQQELEHPLLCGERPFVHSLGKILPFVLALFTWKPLNSTRPHCCLDAAPTGALNVYCCTVDGSVEQSQ